jgi:hypothetical protein
MAPILGIYASSVSPNVFSTSYESIATVTVGAGGTSSITFSSIPSTYQHLQIRCLMQETQAGTDWDNFNAVFNSDTGANYTRHFLEGNGATATAFGAANRSAAFVGMVSRSGAGASVFGINIIDILDYANTNKYKTVRSLAGFDRNGGGSVGLFSSAWLSTSAITSIVLTADSGSNFSQYSSFALYGIKG